MHFSVHIWIHFNFFFIVFLNENLYLLFITFILTVIFLSIKLKTKQKIPLSEHLRKSKKI